MCLKSDKHEFLFPSSLYILVILRIVLTNLLKKIHTIFPKLMLLKAWKICKLKTNFNRAIDLNHVIAHQNERANAEACSKANSAHRFQAPRARVPRLIPFCWMLTVQWLRAELNMNFADPQEKQQQLPRSRSNRSRRISQNHIALCAYICRLRILLFFVEVFFNFFIAGNCCIDGW